MASRHLLPALTVLICLAGTGGALAQSVEPDEAIKPNGTIDQKTAFTAAQEHAIYNAVMTHQLRSSSAGVPVAVGAAVPQAVELPELPDQVATEAAPDTPLKYAMVEGDVVVVDPVTMLVVDVIRGNAR